MIQANELRIGNWVSFKGLWNGQVEQIWRGSIILKDNDNLYPFGCFKGIKLSHEILSKCGFKESNDDGLFEHKDCELFQLQLNYLGGVGYSHVWDAAFTGIVIEHLHHLQNKFYFDTGKEIEYKP